MNHGASAAQIRPADRWIIAATFVLLGISVLMVFSTTAVASQEAFGTPTGMVRQHLFHVLLGLVAFYFFSRINPCVLYRFGLPMLLFGILMLFLVIVPQIGHGSGGAQRWVQVGPLRMQPGEMCKLVVIFYFATYIDRHHEQMLRFVPGVLIPFAILGAYGLLLLLEPDFGSTVVLVLVVLGQLFHVARLSHLIGVGVVAAVSFAALIFSSPYRMQRFVAFLDPFTDPAHSGYQLIQSLIAVGSGGMLGAGLGAGKQKLFYLPAAHTDFIYAVISEELGLLGALAVLFLFLLILYRGLRTAKRLSANPFLCSLTLGCTLLMVIPALLNIAVVLGLLPTKGLVLPLVAYGGTAMVVHLAAVGMLVRLSRMES
jgi:cell division protein FtsW